MSFAVDRLTPLCALFALALASCDRPATRRGDSATSGATTAASAAAGSALASPPSAALVTAASADERAALDRLPPGDGHALIVANCITCHGVTIIVQQHKDTTGWSKTVTQMVSWGSPLPKDSQPVLVRYLATHYPARRILRLSARPTGHRP